MRPNDPRSITGDNGRLRRTTGWAPERRIEETVRDYVADHLSQG
jgi:nucleoside-diphosphate-sugar epimerase